MNSLEQITSQMVVLPTGVVVLGGLLFLVLGLTLLIAGIRTWVRWRRLIREYGPGDLPATMDLQRRKGREKDEKAA